MKKRNTLCGSDSKSGWRRQEAATWQVVVPRDKRACTCEAELPHQSRDVFRESGAFMNRPVDS